jgi:hypothetical protein
METRFGNLLTTIRDKKILDDELKGSLTKAITEFTEQFTAVRGAAAKA